MGKEKKFGTFAGVFTPSILTILGVIMYMRLSWVVGEAGLVGTIIIIVIAHVISITTGLSISSIATDKKIKAGGIYYMLSRSLGLPMGGAIGIALLIGTALSISMYIIGFAENFLNIDAISTFLNLAPSINSYRIVGTAVILILVILAFISTSLAIKSQYFVLGAIFLSLISIFVGFSMHPEFLPAKPVLFLAKDGMNIEKIFAIFFPAVTGFTAGVAMSGDLKDPKKNIPRGTLFAIAVGFIVYIALAISFGFFINRETLTTDTNIAMNVAWIPALVIAGIWGATLSSALGGILGGPRILQALSTDNVTPKIFAKGSGKTNEPRTALIMVFVVAEAGIMIGNLNIIAGVVTMFYLASYGFINLAYVLENWASTDFRPSFKISNIFGVVGFVFAFTIMFKLDIVSMLVAFFVIGLIYFILQRKQLKLDYGDVWQSVWLSVVRKGLHILDKNAIEDRNWQPNIILFSGGNEKRPHLIEFGKSLVGKFGLLSNFDLTVSPDADVLFPKHKQSTTTKSNSDVGIFTRKQSCKNIYDGIEMIVRTYGFSGIEPNTIILGWGRQSKNPERFVRLVETINDLDYNTLLIDYDKRFGYGNYKQIDIWWRGAGNNGNFALSLAKFMLASEKWENATIRLMIVNNEDSKAFYIYRQAEKFLTNLRISAEIKIINNEVENSPFYNIIRKESKTADLVFIGIPPILAGKEKEFVERTNSLLHEIGTVVLIKASSLFRELSLGINFKQKSVISATINMNLVEEIINDLRPSKQQEFHEHVKKSFEGIVHIYDKTIATFIYKEIDVFSSLINEFKKYKEDIFNLLNDNLPKLEGKEKTDYISRYQEVIIKKTIKKLENFKKNEYIELKETMHDILLDYNQQITKYLQNTATDIILLFDISEFKIKSTDNFNLKIFKLYHRTFNKINNNQVKIIFPAKERVNTITEKLYEVIIRQIEQIRIETLRFIYNFEEFVLKTLNSLNDLKDKPNNIDIIIKKFDDNYANIEKSTNLINNDIVKNRKAILLKVLNNYLKNTENIDIFHSNRIKKIKAKTIRTYNEIIESKNNILFESFNYYINYIQLKSYVKVFNIKIVDIISKLQKEITENINLLEGNTENTNKQIDNKIQIAHKEIDKNLQDLPKSIIIIEGSNLNDSFYKDFNYLKTTNIQLKQVLLDIYKNEIFKKIDTSTLSLKNDIISTEKVALNTFISDLESIKTEILGINLSKIIDKNTHRKDK